MEKPGDKLHADVLVIGDHPCSYLAAALLRQEPGLSVLHISRRPCTDPRLTLLNPAFFKLHPMLAGLKDRLKLKPVSGLKFLSDDFNVSSQHSVVDEPMNYVCDFADFCRTTVELARESGVELLEKKAFEIHHLDEKGVSVHVDGRVIHPAAIILSEPLEAPKQQLLGISEEWDHEVFYRITSAAVPTPPVSEDPLIMRMSLDIGGTLAWGWLLVHDHHAQVVVAQPESMEASKNSKKLLRQWVRVLQGHGELPKDISLTDSQITSSALPLAGALANEAIGNRTMLIGPAGGFYSASAEDLYPNCWSAFFAAEVLLKALRETHLQDAINQYRMIWRTTLGDYLRGPQQNLRFLLPLIYRNQTMTTRLAESILLGKQVVR